ncbi:MAG: diguanylate cyclase [Burkholderiales bacterium]|nr:diguanylate cyclase [Burkholderiales bacterium]
MSPRRRAPGSPGRPRSAGRARRTRHERPRRARAAASARRGDRAAARAAFAARRRRRGDAAVAPRRRLGRAASFARPAHRALGRRAARTTGRAHRRGAPLAGLALDLDPFERVHDGPGHEAGDAALVEVVRAARRKARGARSHPRGRRLAG